MQLTQRANLRNHIRLVILRYEPLSCLQLYVIRLSYLRQICVAVLGLLALCIGRLVPALAAFCVPVDVTH